MYFLEVRDHIMVAHSLRGEAFGPAQKLHGATFVVDVAFFATVLGRDNVVVDIGRATEVLKEVLAPLAYANLDALFPGEITTTEFLCRHIFDGIARAAREGRLGEANACLQAIRVTLHESHVARAAYEGTLADG
jgi:6-pyruvoyl-tetrahydropterin synthase